ncbi:hypothetical protein D5018_19275 [Parashewanella curva]|uniref:Uncharacterized protein n=1 Tax=Parashewanella curva TaxID=2338552 RepID=A0A3L8PTY8_9GAMM|nr:hypothetical protein [Parashewanella curva]RLV58063.1 hypothetical protein D5018_19275 [Parashewanella curva]
MTQIIQLALSTSSVDEMLEQWRTTCPNLSPTLTLFLIEYPEAEIPLELFAYYLSDALGVFDEPLFGICLAQAIKNYEHSDLQGDELDYDRFFEALTYIAADLLHNIKIEDQQGAEWRVVDGIHITDWFVLNPTRLKQLEIQKIKIEPLFSERQTVRRVQQMLKNKMCLADEIE